MLAHTQSTHAPVSQIAKVIGSKTQHGGINCCPPRNRSIWGKMRVGWGGRLPGDLSLITCTRPILHIPWGTGPMCTPLYLTPVQLTTTLTSHWPSALSVLTSHWSITKMTPGQGGWRLPPVTPISLTPVAPVGSEVNSEAAPDRSYLTCANVSSEQAMAELYIGINCGNYAGRLTT